MKITQEGTLHHGGIFAPHVMTQARMGEIIDRATAEIEKDMLTIGKLRRALVRIQELATDTLTPEDMGHNLNLIVGECQRVLSDT